MNDGFRHSGLLVSHLLVPLVLTVILLAAIAALDADHRIAQTFFFDDSTQRWIGRDNFWTNEFLHRGGRNLMRLIAVLAIAGWVTSFYSTRLKPSRRALGYLALCLAIVPLTVGALKETTNVDCPWDLQGFGGERPEIRWYEDRPEGLPRAACFPGAHSSSAFALFAFYFVLLANHSQRARLALGAVLVLGTAFSVAQQSRGAHFVSHDLVSALIAWLICLGLYWKLLRHE
ncbi:MAG: phosphatase PAP2 family protein [Steroidobacteraceae bacterium]|jgi:membrane-associated PAP2 superfamily phosphatase